MGPGHLVYFGCGPAILSGSFPSSQSVLKRGSVPNLHFAEWQAVVPGDSGRSEAGIFYCSFVARLRWPCNVPAAGLCDEAQEAMVVQGLLQMSAAHFCMCDHERWQSKPCLVYI